VLVVDVADFVVVVVVDVVVVDEVCPSVDVRETAPLP
jgi:hypothetical protein